MNRRGFLRTSGLATAAVSGLALRHSPAAAGQLTRNTVPADVTVFTSGQTAFSILIANLLTGRSLASDWAVLETSLSAIESFWVTYKVDAVAATLLSRAAAADPAPQETNIETVLRGVQVFHPGASLAQLATAVSSLDHIPPAILRQTRLDVQHRGFCSIIQQVRSSAGRLAAELRGFTAGPGPSAFGNVGARLHPAATLSNCTQSIAFAGPAFAALSVFRSAEDWHAIADWGSYAVVATALTAMTFEVWANASSRMT